VRSCKKKVVESIVKWFETAERDSKGNWTYNDDTISVLPSRAIFSIWDNYRKTGGYPEPGGWLDQPLDVVIQMSVIQTTYDTFEYKNTDDSDWSKFTPTQRELIRQANAWL